jgi:hypothetical protein
LDIAEVGAEQVHGCIEHRFERRLHIVGLDDQAAQSLQTHRGPQLHSQGLLCLLSLRDIGERQHDALDAVFDPAIGAQPHHEPSVVRGPHLGFHRHQAV